MANRKPGFFKFMATPRCLERIQIPADYTKYGRGNLPSIVILKDQYENYWPVEVEKVGSELFLAKGWETFVQENHLEVGDFIVFNYEGHNVFSIVLVGQDSYNKKGIGGLKIEEAVESDQEIDEVEEGKQEVDKEKEASKGTPNDSTGGLKAEGFKKWQNKKKLQSKKKLQTKKLISHKRARFSNKKSHTVPSEVKGKLGASQSERYDDGSIELVSYGRPFYSTSPQHGPSTSINSTTIINCQDFKEVLETRVEQLNEQHAQQIREMQEQHEKFLEDNQGMLANIQGVREIFQSQVKELTRQHQARVEEQKRINQDQFREFCSRLGVSLSDTFSPFPFVHIDSETETED